MVTQTGLRMLSKCTFIPEHLDRSVLDLLSQLWFVDENKHMREMCDKVTQKTVAECDSQVDAMTKTICLLERESKQQAQCSEKLQQEVGVLITRSTET